MAWDIEPVAGPYGFTEGPVWDGEAILFSDMPNDCIRRYDVATGNCSVLYSDTGAANGLKFDEQGRLYACEMNGRRVSRYDTDGGRSTIADRYEGGRLNSPNDLAIADGHLWFTDPYYAGDWEPEDKVLELDHRSVYRVDLTADEPDLVRATTETAQPNGILVSPDRSTLYVADSEYGKDNPRELLAYPIREDRSLGEPSVLHNFYPHRGIDGMCLDADGNIIATAGWADSGPGSMVYVFSPTGRVLETHPFQDSLPTNCAFGDDDLRTLYLTGGDGYLYRARTDREGYLGAPDGA